MGSPLGHSNLWVQDLDRNTSVRLTSLPGASDSPVWSIDRKHILFRVANQQNGGIYWTRSDGVGEPRRLADMNACLLSFSPDGKRVAPQAGNPFTAMEVSTAAFVDVPDGPQLGKPEIFLRARGFPMPVFSDDGRWLAYSSQETGRPRVVLSRNGSADHGGRLQRRTRDLFAWTTTALVAEANPVKHHGRTLSTTRTGT